MLFSLTLHQEHRKAMTKEVTTGVVILQTITISNVQMHIELHIPRGRRREKYNSKDVINSSDIMIVDVSHGRDIEEELRI